MCARLRLGRWRVSQVTGFWCSVCFPPCSRHSRLKNKILENWPKSCTDWDWGDSRFPVGLQNCADACSAFILCRSESLIQRSLSEQRRSLRLLRALFVAKLLLNRNLLTALKSVRLSSNGTEQNISTIFPTLSNIWEARCKLDSGCASLDTLNATPKSCFTSRRLDCSINQTDSFTSSSD